MIKLKKTRRKLPDNLSDLLEMAIEDAQRVEKAGHELNMSWWYSRKKDKCSVCLAGAVMLCELPTGKAEALMPCDFSVEDRRKLLLIENMREGVIGYNWVSDTVYITFRNIIDSHYNNKLMRAPWATYKKAAKYLRSKGL